MLVERRGVLEWCLSHREVCRGEHLQLLLLGTTGKMTLVWLLGILCRQRELLLLQVFL